MPKKPPAETLLERPQKAAFRYSPQKVTRYIAGKGASSDELICVYEDATVRDQGTGSNFLRANEAMLRAYSNDPEFFGDEDYREGNGISIWTAEDQARHLKGGGHPDDFVVGAVYDCDSDLAIKRITMNVVISSFHYGHGAMEYVGFVSKSDYPVRRGEEFDGFGYGDGDVYRIERWRVGIAAEDRDE
jgi:hypothetical protein